MLRKKNKYVVAVIGATSVEGREIIDVLDERNFPVDALLPFASERYAGERLEFKGKGVTARDLTKDSFANVDVAFFAEGTEPSIEFAPVAVSAGAVVIDASGAFRRDPKVPLALPEVTGRSWETHSGIIALPGSMSSGLALILAPIRKKTGIKRVVAATFQSVSGTGKKAMDELAQQTVSLLNFRDLETKVYPHQIAFSCIPQVGSFLETGQSKEEEMIESETRRLLEDDALGISATCALVPVFRGHAAALNIELKQSQSANDIRAALSEAPGVLVYDDPGKSLYPLAVDCVGKDEVRAGRIREDHSLQNGISLWIAFDNIRRGVALNAVQLAEELIK